MRRLRYGTGAKFIAKPTIVDGLRFASKREAHRYVELRVLARKGSISDLRVHPRYPLHAPGGQRLGVYEADFDYTEAGFLVVEDVKAPPSRTVIYRWKVKHLAAEYGIVVREVA